MGVPEDWYGTNGGGGVIHPSLKTTFSARLSHAMEESSLSQAALERKAGIHQSSVSRYLSKGRLPGAEELRAISLALGVSADYLLGLREGAIASPEPSTTKVNQLTLYLLRGFRVRESAALVGRSEVWGFQKLAQLRGHFGVETNMQLFYQLGRLSVIECKEKPVA